jgi:hypothetical protein
MVPNISELKSITFLRVVEQKKDASQHPVHSV